MPEIEKNDNVIKQDLSSVNPFSNSWIAILLVLSYYFTPTHSFLLQSVYQTTTFVLCHFSYTFPWTAESSWWFPERQPVFAPFLCSYRCFHSERTPLLAARPPSLRWPELIWVPQVLCGGHQLWPRENRGSASAWLPRFSSWWWAVALCMFTSPIATVKFHPDVPQATIFQWSFFELLQSLRMIQ